MAQRNTCIALRLALAVLLLLLPFSAHAENGDVPTIEVTGSATMNIVPDRITVEIGMEEYHKHTAAGDSVLVRLSDIERDVRATLGEAGVPSASIIVSEVGNYRNRDVSDTFLMAKKLSATLSDINGLNRIYERLDRKGVTSFNIVKIDNSDIDKYNREGLKAALDAARNKAQLIAESEGLELLAPYEIIENTPEAPGYYAVSNAAYDGGSGMENMRRIVRRYSVRVRYLFSSKAK